MSRLRIAWVVIQPYVVWDDGDCLEPGPRVQPRAIPMRDLDGLAARLRAELADMQDDSGGSP